MKVSRRHLLIYSSSAFALAGCKEWTGLLDTSSPVALGKVKPVASRYIRLKPSIFADAMAANRRYLLSLDPRRLLHNFYLSAGLPAPEPRYEGWEALGIAGHSMGHWLSACSLMLANQEDSELSQALDLALAEMARIQQAHGDGYCGGTTVERDGQTVDGKIVFEEVRQGTIWSSGFDLNGGWVPLYTWHKVQAGLLDAHTLAKNPRALPIALGLADYMAKVLEALDDQQMQKVLAAEHGGLNESYAEIYALSGNRRWLDLAERIRHKAVLNPLAAGLDQLDGLHANTQIPKIIGLARLHEVTGINEYAKTSQFFHQQVTQHHSYVIGGNSEREHFGPADQLSRRLGESTCEACNSYNMLKLTRHLYSWQPDARLFDFYERVQLNHIMAHQRPDTGQFVYFMPLATGARRSYSTAEESFWCCVGSGMESHSKHADSIYWQQDTTLYVNLFIPSVLDWQDGGMGLELETSMPMDGKIQIRINRTVNAERTLAIRIPGWTCNPLIRLNGNAIIYQQDKSYARLARHWQQGDSLDIEFPMTLQYESTPDDPSVIAFTKGPLVLAAELGPAASPYNGTASVLVTDQNPASHLLAQSDPMQYRVTNVQGETLALKPFFSQYDTRTAVYFNTFSSSQWREVKEDYLAQLTAARDLARRTIDTVYLGEMQPERDHDFKASAGETVQLHGRSARKLRAGEQFSLYLARRPGDAVLRLTFWGTDLGKTFEVEIDGTPLTRINRQGDPTDEFVSIDVSLPTSGTANRQETVFSFRGISGDIDIYEVRMISLENTLEDLNPI